MYQVKYWSLNSLRSKMFQSMHEAVMFAVYKTPFQSVHSIDLIKE